MGESYELWDVEAGNIVGSFATQDEGLDIARTLLEAYGPTYADDLTFTRREDDGVARVVAKGEQLLRLLAQRDLEAPIQAASVRASS